LAALPEAERSDVEAASAVLRKMRAGRDTTGSRQLVPLRAEEGP
jgi:hypothetical protein